MEMPDQKTLAEHLRRTERLFDSANIEVPQLAPGDQLTYFDFHDQKLLIDNYFHAEQEILQCYILGRALAEYVHYKINPRIFQQIGSEGFDKICKISDAPLPELELTLFAMEVSPLHKIRQFTPFYAGLLLTEQLIREKSPSDEPTKTKITDFIRACYKKRSFELSNGVGSLFRLHGEALKWYAAGGEWLPRLARINSADEYRALTRLAGVKSDVLSPPGAPPSPPQTFYKNRRF